MCKKYFYKVAFIYTRDIYINTELSHKRKPTQKNTSTILVAHTDTQTKQKPKNSMFEYIYSQNYTTILVEYYTCMDPDDDCHCDPGYYNGICMCHLTDHPRYECIQLLVRVLGNPIQTLPNESTYNICIWTKTVTQEGRDQPPPTSEEVFANMSADYEFTIANTVDDVDLERMQFNDNNISDLFHKVFHYGRVLNFSHSFRARCGIESYKKGFQELVKRLLEGSREREQNMVECEHFKGKMEKKGKKKKNNKR